MSKKKGYGPRIVFIVFVFCMGVLAGVFARGPWSGLAVALAVISVAFSGLAIVYFMAVNAKEEAEKTATKQEDAAP